MKVALIWAGCFVLLFFVHILALSPQKKTKEQIEEQLAEKKQIYESALKATRKETKRKLEEQIERLRSELENFVFEDSGNLTFDISQTAEEKRIVPPPTIKGRDKRGGSTAAKRNYVHEDYININFTGSFNQFATFLNALERHRPIVFVDTFKITRSKRDNSDHQVNMELAVFVRKRQDS